MTYSTSGHDSYPLDPLLIPAVVLIDIRSIYNERVIPEVDFFMEKSP